MGGVSVYEVDLKAFRLRRRISAERASWVPALHSWVLENGWVRDLKGAREADFCKFQAEIFRELDAYIRELRQSGFDTVRLQVQLHINQLPATLAAWSPDAIFCLAGVYLMARMRT